MLECARTQCSRCAGLDHHERVLWIQICMGSMKKEPSRYKFDGRIALCVGCQRELTNWVEAGLTLSERQAVLPPGIAADFEIGAGA